jgi:murein tripeptide amidase MpaA
MVAPGQMDEFTKLMSSTSTKYEMFIEDVQRLIDEEKRTTRTGDFGWTSYHSLEEIYDWLDSLQVKYPDKVEVLVGGRTYQDREIKGVKMSFGPEKPGVFVEGGIHAREWISPATVTYLIDQLLNSQEPEIRSLAESYDWYMFPSFNPDGYVYTHTSVSSCNDFTRPAGQ